MRKLVVIAILALAGLAPTAQAHSTQATAKYYKARGVVRWIGAHARTTQYHPDPVIKRRWQAAVHYWVTVRDNAWNELHPAPAPVAGHWDGWMCIHGGEGNGHNPAGYDGPLQMTTPWAGYSLAWNSVPMSTVFAIAERVASQHNWSYDWMVHQWPNTFPPCSRFF